MRFLLTKCVLSLLLVLFWTNTLFGQVQEDVKKVILTKDFVAFKELADNLLGSDKVITARWECLRELTPDFKEGIFTFTVDIPDKKNSAISSYTKFKINIIIEKSKILYYEFNKERERSLLYWKEDHYKLTDKFSNEAQLERLKKNFQDLFKSGLDRKQLFVINFPYGENCSIDGTAPEGREQVEKWIKAKDKTELLRWLRSTNTEKQVYAVEGLHRLSKSGISLTQHELNLIRVVINKEGTINVCSGCSHGQENIRSITSKFTF